MKFLTVAVAGLSVAGVAARCPNDCSNHGQCNHASICECFHGYVGNDCSQRQCTYAKAYTDTPLGDLNADEELDVDQQVHFYHANAVTGEMYSPHYGLARTSNSEEWNEAHFYRECANKGLCDRKTGQCDCFPGFEGEGCQRTACPSGCNGHGRCVANSFLEAEYDAWDWDVTQGCLCDPGYTGADCSKRECALGVDPEESRGTDTSTVFKIEFARQGDKGGGTTFYDGTTMLPNGETLFTVTLQDDFGDEFTTPASTVYYQADCSENANEFQPDTTTSAAECLSTAFPVDPYAHDDGEMRSVRSATTLRRVFGNSSILYDSSFVGEHLNNSLNALPSSAARGSLVFVSANTAVSDATAAWPFVYPALYAPDFDALGSAAATQEALVCYKDAAYHNGMCNTALDYSQGPTPFLSNPKNRFPIFVQDSQVSGEGFADAARRYLNCAEGSVCVFIRLNGAASGRVLTVRYKYKADVFVANRTVDYSTVPTPVAVSAAADPDDYEVLSGPEMTGWSRFVGNSTGAGGVTTSSTGSIVTVTEVGSDRKWYPALDGTPDTVYNSGMGAHVCSKRGLCDYDTGLCSCFSGYHGPACSTRQ